jgi:ribosome biogenesis GTP-binding protein YsxC/EngB
MLHRLRAGVSLGSPGVRLASTSILPPDRTHVAEARLQRVRSAMGGDIAAEIDQRVEKGRFFKALDKRTDEQWMHGQHMARRHDEAFAKDGIEATVREALAPSTRSFNEELRSRKLDKRLLAEIHREGHGLRSDRMVRKGWSLERFVAQDDRNAPVRNASARAQETFGMGASVSLVTATQDAAEFPVSSLPEVAFVGRTNVGKSAVINAVLNAPVCAYGNLPGTTTSAHFYKVGKSLTIVDLPGYGFYNPSMAGKLDAANAVAVSRQYLRCAGRHELATRNIKRVFVCVTPQGLFKDDVQQLEFLERIGCPFAVIVNKTDKMPVMKLAKRVDYMRTQLAHYNHCEELMMVSALRLAGISPLQNIMAGIARPAERSYEALAEEIANLV